MKNKIILKKIKVYEKIINAFIIGNIGVVLNFIVIKANDVWMPVSTEDVKLRFLSDIIRIPTTNFFISVGDLCLIGAVLYLCYWALNTKKLEKENQKHL